MSVYVDARETSIPIANAIPVERLEEWTGADLMISRLSIPCKTRSLLAKHLESRAILTQLKIGEDLASSVGDRLNDSLSRMVNVTRHTASRLLLFVGTIGCNAEGSATINGYRTHKSISFATLDGACVGWMARGGIFYSLPRIELLDGWCRAMERRLVQYEAEPIKYVFGQDVMPDELDGALQLPVRVRDGRNVLIAFRGLGPNLVNRIWAYTGSLHTALNFLTDPSNTGKVADVGEKTIASIRKQCGLGPNDGPLVVDTSTIAELPKRTKEQVAADTELIFGKKRNGANA